MNANPATTTIALLLLLSIAASAGIAPEQNDDLGGGWGGFEPDPPSIEPPSLDIVADSLGIITSLDVSGLVPGEDMTAQLGDATLLFQNVADVGLVTTLVSPDGVTSMTLPVSPEDPGDFTALITPLTISVDQVGDNPASELLSKDNIIDGTMMTGGLISSLGTLGDDGPIPDPAEVQKNDSVDVIADKVSLVSPLDSIMTLAVIDPDNLLIIGSLAEHTAQLPTTTTVASTSAAIKSALDTNALTALSLDSVLAGLADSSKLLGAVDTTKIAGNLVDMGYTLNLVDLPINDPATILDPDNLKLMIVDGGLGKISFLADPAKMVFDPDLVTGLKDPNSNALTNFVTVSKLTGGDLPDKYALGQALFHPSLGNYQSQLTKVDGLMKHGFVSEFMPAGVSCKTQLANQMDTDAKAPGFCLLPNADSFPLKGANALGSLMKPDLNPKLAGSSVGKSTGLVPKAPGTPGGPAVPKAPGSPGGPALPGKPPVPPVTGVGTPLGGLKDLPVPKNFLVDNGTFGAFGMMPKDLSKYQLGDWKIPDNGFGSLPDIDAPNADAVKTLNCTGTCLPDHVPTVADGIFESFQSPSIAGIAPVVPTDALTGVVGTFMNAAGNGISLIPLSMLQDLPLGTDSTKTARFIGGQGSFAENTGIGGVKVQVDSTDPLGITKATATLTSNDNGYVSMTLFPLGSYTITATKSGYESVSGAGQAPAPGQTAGEEYTMKAASGNAIADELANHGVNWIIFVLIGGLLLLMGSNAWKKHKAKKGGKA